MEIILLWLDELDDLVFVGFSVWRRIIQVCLAVLMTAAFWLLALSLSNIA